MKSSHDSGSRSGTKTYLGDLLVRRGQVRSYQLSFLLQLQKAYRKISRPVKIGELLIAHRVLPGSLINEALALQQVYAHQGGDLSAVLQSLNQEEATDTIKK